MIDSISFFVPGLPAPGGSKRFVGFGKKTGRAILIDAAGQRNKDWKANVGWNAQKAMEGREMEMGRTARLKSRLPGIRRPSRTLSS